MKLKDAKIQQTGFKLVQAGEPGAGKTYRACSAARFGPIKVWDIDNKLIELKNRLPKEWVDKIDVDVITTPEAFTKSIAEMHTYPKHFSTLVIDTLSRLYDRAVEKVRAQNPKGDGRQIYGVAYGENKQLLPQILSLPMNIIINAHVGMETMEDGTQKLTSSTAGKFGKEVPEFVNEVHYCYLNIANKHKVRGEPASNVVARTVCDKKLLDAQGIFLTEDLSIFDDRAYRISE